MAKKKPVREEKAKAPKEQEPDQKLESISLKRKVLLASGLAAWLVFSFYAASFITSLVLGFLIEVDLITVATNESIVLSVAAAVIYALAIVIAIGIPLKLYGIRTTKEELGLTRLPSWMDLLLAPASFVIYMIVAAILLAVIAESIPGFNAEETQEIGFENLRKSYEYVLAFLTLVVAAPIAEELLVRGYLYGKLRKVLSVTGAVLLSAVLFAALHLGINTDDGFAITQWNVALNILPLGIILAILREHTGSVWAGVMLHMIKNGLAFYLLFIVPDFLDTISK